MARSSWSASPRCGRTGSWITSALARGTSGAVRSVSAVACGLDRHRHGRRRRGGRPRARRSSGRAALRLGGSSRNCRAGPPSHGITTICTLASISLAAIGDDLGARQGLAELAEAVGQGLVVDHVLAGLVAEESGGGGIGEQQLPVLGDQHRLGPVFERQPNLVGDALQLAARELWLGAAAPPRPLAAGRGAAAAGLDLADFFLQRLAELLEGGGIGFRQGGAGRRRLGCGGCSFGGAGGCGAAAGSAPESLSSSARRSVTSSSSSMAKAAASSSRLRRRAVRRMSRVPMRTARARCCTTVPAAPMRASSASDACWSPSSSVEVAALVGAEQQLGRGIEMAEAAVAPDQDGRGGQEVEGGGHVGIGPGHVLARPTARATASTPWPAIGQGVDHAAAGEGAFGGRGGEVEINRLHLAAVQAARQVHQRLDARFLLVEGAVDQVEKRGAAEKGDAGRVGPDDARPSGVPQPGGFRHVPQVFQRRCRGVGQQLHPKSQPVLFTMA